MPDIITLEFRFYYKRWAGIFHGILKHLMLPSGCLDLWPTAALRQHEVLLGRAFWPGSLERPCHFVPQRSDNSCRDVAPSFPKERDSPRRRILIINNVFAQSIRQSRRFSPELLNFLSGILHSSYPQPERSGRKFN